MKYALLLLLSGCACVNPQECRVAHPQFGHHYGHTYYGVRLTGATR